jgi:hypothetical protein
VQRLRPYHTLSISSTQLEHKTDLALPLLEKAVANWDLLNEEQKQTRHQEKKNFVKALYQLASAHLETGDAEAISLAEDLQRNNPRYPKLGALLFKIRSGKENIPREGSDKE